MIVSIRIRKLEADSKDEWHTLEAGDLSKCAGWNKFAMAAKHLAHVVPDGYKLTGFYIRKQDMPT